MSLIKVSMKRYQPDVLSVSVQVSVQSIDLFL